MSSGESPWAGRMASLIADTERVAGLVCLGYPFHPPGKPDRLQAEHLEDLRTPALFCQGERDSFGGKAEVGEYPLSPRIRLCWLADGDHSFKPRKASGLTVDNDLERAAEAIKEFLASLSS